MSDSSVDTLPTIKRSREVKRSLGGAKTEKKMRRGSQTGRGQWRGCEEGKGDKVEGGRKKQGRSFLMGQKQFGSGSDLEGKEVSI